MTTTQITETELALLRFPGSVPGVLRRGSPVIKTWNAPCIPDDDPNDEFTLHGIYLRDLDEDEAGRRCYCWFDSEQIGLDVGFPPDIDLTDATGRAHLAWWLGGGEPKAFGGWFANHTAEINNEGFVVRTVAAWMGRKSDGQWQRYQAEPTVTFREPRTIIVPTLSTLDPDDPRLLPDGSRLVDALALSLVARHVAGLDKEPPC